MKQCSDSLNVLFDKGRLLDYKFIQKKLTNRIHTNLKRLELTGKKLLNSLLFIKSEAQFTKVMTLLREEGKV